MERIVLAKTLAREAGKIVLDYSRKEFLVKTKQGGSLVTDADTAAERHIIQAIQKYFPDDAIVGEESGLYAGSSGFSWHIDPLDGTTNFARHIPLYAVSIGIVKDEAPVGGAIYLPPFNELYEAEQGKGAKMNGIAIVVSSVSELSQAMVALASPRFVDAVAHDTLPLGKIASRIGKIRVPASIAVNLCWIARGAIDAGVCVGQNSWDAAAGVILVREAGGEAFDFSGKPYTVASPDLIVGNNILITAIQKMIHGPDH